MSDTIDGAVLAVVMRGGPGFAAAVLDHERSVGDALRFYVEIQGGYDTWESAVEALLRLAVAGRGGHGKGYVVGLGDACWDGAGYVGVGVKDGALETYFEDELQNLDSATIDRFAPEGMRD